jgi:hypothetical protein
MQRLVKFTLICACLGTTFAETQTVARPTTLQDALRAGTVVATIVGTGASSGDSVRVALQKTPSAGPGPLTLTIPRGSVLMNHSRGYQNMVVARVRGRDSGGLLFTPQETMVVQGKDPVTYLLSAYCANFFEENPTKNTSFDIHDSKPMLACLVNRGRPLSINALQAAVWMYTDGIPLSRMKTKFNVTFEDWESASKIFHQCEAESLSKQAAPAKTHNSMPDPVGSIVRGMTGRK